MATLKKLAKIGGDRINLDRANLSATADVMEHLWDLHKQGVPYNDLFVTAVAEKAVERYQFHIGAAFRRAGIQIDDGEKITLGVLMRVINEKTGLDIQQMTPDGVRLAFDEKMSAQATDALGVEIKSMDSIDVIKKAVLESAKKAVESGKATRLVTKVMIKRIRTMKAFTDQDIHGEIERKKVLNRAAQKRYRKTHKEVWEGSPSDTGTGWDQSMYQHTRDN